MKKIVTFSLCVFTVLTLSLSACKGGNTPVPTPKPSEIPNETVMPAPTETPASVQPTAEAAPATADPAAEQAARDYYLGTVFEVVSLKIKSITENEIVFDVCVKKGGVIQEPDRSITLQMTDGVWQVVNEGY